MSLSRIGFIAAAALLSGAASAQAGAPATAGKPQVYVCERPTPAAYVPHRDGGRLQFVSARELLSDAALSARPRCITRTELKRYQALYAQRSRTVASR